MTVLKTKDEIIALSNSIISQQKSIGFVPTMGALHDGHLSLIKKAIIENDIVVVSIFVNPTQFDNATDLEKYPRTIEKDTNLINHLNNEVIVFAPSPKELYSSNVISKKYSFDGLEHEMEGKHRTGHFDGVGTVLELFFKLVKPTNAYFGEKDFQQLQIVKKLVSKYKLGVTIIGCDIYRETSGLAMSSRNERLSTKSKTEAAFIYKTLLQAKKIFGTKSALKTKEWVENQFRKNNHLDLEYVEIASIETLKPIRRKSKQQQYRIFIAAYIDNIRLIDNIALN